MRRLILLALLLGACSKEPTTVRVIAPPEPAKAPAAQTPEAPIPPGTPAPDFEATAHDGTKVTLASLRGRAVVLYFYPKDDTPGCTAEARGFRDDYADFAQLGATIIGVSTDSLASHKEFAAENDLPFLLVADTDKRLATRYGVDTTLGYAHRVTFVIAPDGTIAATFDDVEVDGHAAEVLRAVAAAARPDSPAKPPQP